MDRVTPNVIADSHVLVDAMDGWPSFHDASLLEVVRTGDRLEVLVHVFSSTDDVDAQGYFVLTNHHLVRFEVRCLASCNVPHGYDGDILDSISAEACAQGVRVAFDSVVDPERCWHAVGDEVRIREVTPCDSNGQPI